MLKVESTAGDGGDSWITSRNHHRSWLMCEACDGAPAAFLCKADAASLCAACDSDIHSANPLARRHHRVPIIFHGGRAMGPPEEDDFLTTQDDRDHDEDEAASWLLLNPVKNGDGGNAAAIFAGGVVDEYLDLDEFNSCQSNQFSSDQYSNQHQHYNLGDDSVVPIRYLEQKDRIQDQFFQLGLDFQEDSKSGFTNYPASVSHNVSSLSPVDVGVVPESAMSEGSIMSNTRPSKGTIDLFSGPLTMQTPPPTQLSPMDREARVLRYREKKKMRKFEKTIRYASRKAYAETRPRIKGRFAKRIS